MPSYMPELFRDRPRHVQVILGGIAPAVLGALAGVLVGASAGAYWAVSLVAAIGGFLAGFEHRDGWGGADRGLIGGAIYGIVLLLVHWATGAHAKVSLGGFPPLLAVITTLIAILLGAAGGRLARLQRERAGIAPTVELD